MSGLHLDVVVILALTGLVFRGWWRGFSVQAVDLLVVVVGTVAALRLNGPAGAVVTRMSGAGSGSARLAGGLAVLLVVLAAGWWVRRGVRRRLGRLRLGRGLDRVLGAAAGLATGVVAATVALVMVRLLVPGAGLLDGSRAAAVLARPEAPGMQILALAAGDDVVPVAVRARSLFGTRTVVLGPDQEVATGIAVAEPEPDADAAAELFESLNRQRVAAGVAPVAWAPALAGVAEAHAAGQARRALLSHRSPDTGLPADRIGSVGFPPGPAGELIVVAPLAADAHDALVRSARATALTDPDHSWVGIAVVATPYGLLAVELFA